MLAPRRSRVAVATLTVLALAGCGGDGDGGGFPAAGTGESKSAPVSIAASAPASTAASAPEGRAARGGVKLVGVGRFNSPLYVTSPPKDKRRLYVVEQDGVVKVVRGGKTLKRPFLDISRLVTSGGEQGLLSVAFPADHDKTGLFYVYYTDRDEKQRVVEYRRSSPDRANIRSARLVLRMDDPERNHNGGPMIFGPDRQLYIGTGDGGGANDQHGPRGNAQNLGSLLGKLLRIDPRKAGSRPYRVPSSNPFVGRDDARPEIWAYGLRNPWRFSFDRSTGDLSIGDVGQNAIEEIDFVKGNGKGANFGWRPFEGTRENFKGEPAPEAIDPVIEKTHSGDGWCSVTGGYVVRDPKLPALRGQYLYGDFCEGRIRAAKLSAGKASRDRRLPLKQVESLASFGEDARARIYVVSLSGAVYRLAAR